MTEKASLAAELVTEDGPADEETYAPTHGTSLRTLHLLGDHFDHFDLHVPKDLIAGTPLPAVLLRTTPPSARWSQVLSAVSVQGPSTGVRGAGSAGRRH